MTYKTEKMTVEIEDEVGVGTLTCGACDYVFEMGDTFLHADDDTFYCDMQCARVARLYAQPCEEDSPAY